MNRRPKVNCQLAHARRRARERLQFEGSRREIERIVESVGSLIREGKARFIESQSQRVSVFEVSYAGQVLYPVYDKRRKVVVTFLTRNMIAKNMKVGS